MLNLLLMIYGGVETGNLMPFKISLLTSNKDGTKSLYMDLKDVVMETKM